jgi:hypothetical protein
MIVAHIMGIPVEETVLQLMSAGAAFVTAAWITGRTSLRRLQRRRSQTTHEGARDEF